MNVNLQALADEIGRDVPASTLDDLMSRAREAQSNANNMLEDMAREITADKEALLQKLQRFAAIAGEIIDIPSRIQGQQ